MTAETQISHLNELKAKRDSIEKELKQLQSNLILPMDASLVDGQGFPRNDVDLFQVRAQRQRVIRKLKNIKIKTLKLKKNN